MERSGDIPAVGVADDDLQRVASRPGPVATVCLSTPSDVELAGPRSVQGWKSLRRALLEQGAPEAVARMIDEVVPDAHLAGRGLVVVASESELRLREHLDEEPRADVARWAPLPSLAAVIEHRQADIPYLVALVDRVGADITARWRSGEASATVEGDDHPIRKVAPGGWSQRRFQARVEDTWERNAAAVAAQLERLATDTRPELIVVAGDVRAVALLRERLPSGLSSLVREVSGGRAADGSAPATDDDIRRLVRATVAADTAALLARFREEAGQADRAANGPAATVSALQAAQVGMLLVHDDPGDERTAWIGPDPTQLALEPDQLAGLGDARPLPARLTDAAIRSALATGAGVRVVPGAGPLDGGLGAVLRWGSPS